MSSRSIINLSTVNSHRYDKMRFSDQRKKNGITVKEASVSYYDDFITCKKFCFIKFLAIKIILCIEA